METLGIIAPVFGMAIIGFTCGKLGILNETASRGLDQFVFKIALPIMLFRTIGKMDLPNIGWTGVLAYYTGCGAMFLLAAILARLVLRLNVTESGCFGMSASFSNTVLLALPITLKLYGDEGVLLLLLVISCHTTFLFTLGTIYVEAGRAGQDGKKNMLRKIGRGLVRNPIIVGLVSGLLWNLSGLELGTVAGEIADMFSETAVPSALFAMGLSLCGFKLGGSFGQTLILAVLKLAVHPFLMWLLAVYVFRLDELWTAVTVIAAGMPSGINSYLFAAGYETRQADIAAAVLFSTGVSIGTASLLLWFVT